MKKTYETPNVEEIAINVIDVLTISNGENEIDVGNGSSFF